MVQDINATFCLVRMVVFGVVSLSAFIVLALCASILTGDYDLPPILGIAIAALNLLTLPLMFYLSLTRKGAFPSLTGLEVGWTFFLWILWGFNSTLMLRLGVQCDYLVNDTLCPQKQAVSAFGFLNAIALLFYDITLLVLVVRQQMRGNSKAWSGYINETDFAAARADSAVPSMATQGSLAPQYQAPASALVYPTQQYQGAPPQQTPPYPQV